MRCEACEVKVGRGNPNADFKAKLCGACRREYLCEYLSPDGPEAGEPLSEPKRKVATKRKAAKG